MASAAVLGGAALPIALAFGWLVASGTLGAAVEAVLGYAAAYRAANAPSGGDLSTSVASWTLLAWAFLLLPAGFGVIGGLRAGSASRELILLSGAWVLLSLVAFAVQGRFIAHYAIPLAIPLGLLAGIGIERAGARASRARIVLASWVPLIVLAAVAGFAGGIVEWRSVDEGEGRAAAAAAELRRETGSGATLLVWGNEPRLYLQSGLRQATPYSYLYPLTTRGYASEELIDELARALRAAPPDAVVDAGSAGPGQPGFLPLLIPRPVATDGRDLDLLDPLRAFVEERYVTLSTVEGWVIYVRR
jgi:hypothetical protein